ncbi:MAG: hypothetical protein ABIA63_09935 [bacterium]
MENRLISPFSAENSGIHGIQRKWQRDGKRESFNGKKKKFQENTKKNNFGESNLEKSIHGSCLNIKSIYVVSHHSDLKTITLRNAAKKYEIQKQFTG